MAIRSIGADTYPAWISASTSRHIGLALRRHVRIDRPFVGALACATLPSSMTGPGHPRVPRLLHPIIGFRG